MILSILGLGAISFVISWLGTWAMIRIAPRIGFVDKPGGRKIHANPKPLGGGIAIFRSRCLLAAFSNRIAALNVSTRCSITAQPRRPGIRRRRCSAVGACSRRRWR